MASNALECDICCNVFSEHRCPRNFPCSHTFCGPCIDGIIETQRKTCPTCREEFTATSAEDLMINRSLLDVVRQLSTRNLKPKTLTKGPTGSFAKLPKEFRKKLTKETIQETETRVSRAKKILDEMEDVFTATETLNKMKDGLLETKKEIGRFKEMLTGIELSIEKTLSKIAQSEDQLEAATDLTLTDPFHDTQEKFKKIKNLLQENQREGDDIMKETLKMKTWLGNVTEEIQKSLEGETLVMSAVKVIEGKQMVAPVRVKPGNQVRLSHFAEGDVKPKSLLIKHEALLKTSPRRAFLDLAIGGTFLARIIIRMEDEGNLALHFLHVCAGDLGPSYANSQLSSVVEKGKAGECINVCTNLKTVMGVDWDKEKQRKIYKSTPYKAGEVRGFLSDAKASQFFIVTSDSSNLGTNCINAIGYNPNSLSGSMNPHPVYDLRYPFHKIRSVNRSPFNQIVNPHSVSWFTNPNSIDNYCFGTLEEGGLDVLRDAISSHPDLTKIQIVDCGLMFSL